MDDADEKGPRPQEDETTYLLRSPKNAKRLLEAIAELEMGNGEAHALIE